MRFLQLIGVFASFLVAGSSGAVGDAAVSEGDEAVAGMILIHDECARPFPELGARTAAGYDAWRLKNKEAIARIEANVEYKARLERDQASIEQQRAKNADAMRKETRDFCEAIFGAAFEPPSTTIPGSPREAWTGFLGALRAGDVQKMLAHFTSGSRGRYREVFAALGPEGLRKASESFGEIQSYDTTGDIAFAYITRMGADGKRQAFEISFMRDRRTGGWFIDSM